MDCSLPGSSVHSNSPGKNTGVGCNTLPPSGDLPNPGIKFRSPTLQADSLPKWPRWKRLQRDLAIYGQCHSTFYTLPLLEALYLTKILSSFLIFDSKCPRDLSADHILKYAETLEIEVLWIQCWVLKFEMKILMIPSYFKTWCVLSKDLIFPKAHLVPSTPCVLMWAHMKTLLDFFFSRTFIQREDRVPNWSIKDLFQVTFKFRLGLENCSDLFNFTLS